MPATSPGTRSPDSRGSWRVPRRVARPAPGLVSVGVAATVDLVLCIVLASAAAVGRPALAVVLWPVQMLLALGWLTLLGRCGRRAGLAVAGGAAGAADLLFLRHDPEVVGAGGAVVAVGFLAAVALQLADRNRRDVTDVLAAHASAVLLVTGAATLVALRGASSGRHAVIASVLALGVGGLVGRAISARWPKPGVAPGRGVFGVVAWVGVGAAVGTVFRGGDGLLLGAAVGGAGAFADLVVAAADRRHALALAATLPFALGAPVAFVLAKVLNG